MTICKYEYFKKSIKKKIKAVKKTENNNNYINTTIMANNIAKILKPKDEIFDPSK